MRRAALRVKKLLDLRGSGHGDALGYFCFVQPVGVDTSSVRFHLQEDRVDLKVEDLAFGGSDPVFELIELLACAG